MSGKNIIDHCSPTLAGLKTGSLFSVRQEGRDLITELRALNGMLRNKGLRALPMNETKDYSLVYIYRPDFLEKDLSNPMAVSILKEKGYDIERPEACLAKLIRHIKNDEMFPHEIGLFLGYPPEDVKGFMKSPNKGVKCVGCWKVYSDRDSAEKTFRKYKICTEVYRREYKMGRSLEQLTIRTDKSGNNK